MAITCPYNDIIHNTSSRDSGLPQRQPCHTTVRCATTDYRLETDTKKATRQQRQRYWSCTLAYSAIRYGPIVTQPCYLSSIMTKTYITAVHNTHTHTHTRTVYWLLRDIYSIGTAQRSAPVAVADSVAVNVIVASASHTVARLMVTPLRSVTGRRYVLIVTVSTSLAPVTCTKHQKPTPYKGFSQHIWCCC